MDVQTFTTSRIQVTFLLAISIPVRLFSISPGCILILPFDVNRVVETGDLDSGIPLSRDFEGFDVISCFNVIDRCATPITLLKQIKARLRDHNSRLILATPLPLNPSVENGKQWVAPHQQIAPKVIHVPSFRCLLF